MKVSGAPTEVGTRRLTTMLGASAWAEREQATMRLSHIGSVGSEVLRVLRTARTRAQGRLTVTAERPEGRFSLALVGRNEMIWTTMRLSERKRRELIDIEAELVSADLGAAPTSW